MKQNVHARWGMVRGWVGIAAGVAVFGCSSDKSSGPAAPLLRDAIASVALAGSAGSATFHSEGAPTAGSGPAVTADVQSAAVIGGSVQVHLESANAFQRVVLATVSGTRGWWEVTLPSAATVADLVVTLAPDSTLGTLDTRFAVGAAGSGSVGAYDEAPISVINTVGTGEVQVSISWDSPTDVDLHVVTPNDEEIFYGNRTSTEGGELDLDSNAACSLDEKRNENTTWANGTAPRGTYTVRVDYWDACAFTGTTHYVVTVRRKGHDPLTFSGTLTGGGDQGGVGSGATVTTFNW